MNAFIMTDAAKYIECRTCGAACVVAHQQNQDRTSVPSSAFIPRIRVIKNNAFTTAVACHQCEGVPCANVCLTHAIRREYGHIFIEQARYIDCKGCTLTCPLGAMNVAARSSRMWTIKCDLCWRREAGPTCVKACPTSALQYVDTVSIQRQRLCSQPL